MHELTVPLNALSKKEWMWQRNAKVRLKRLKKALTSDLSQTHFDPKLNIVVASDASDLGIGAVLLHIYDDGTTKPIAHALRSLIATETNYSQIDKEALAIIFAIKRSHKFLHGQEFSYKPTIVRYCLYMVQRRVTAFRLQCWETILLNYNYKMELFPSKKFKSCWWTVSLNSEIQRSTWRYSDCGNKD